MIKESHGSFELNNEKSKQNEEIKVTRVLLGIERTFFRFHQLFNVKKFRLKKNSNDLLEISQIEILQTKSKQIGPRFSLYNRGKLKNPYIFGALFTLKIPFKYTQTQCEDGARAVRVL